VLPLWHALRISRLVGI